MLNVIGLAYYLFFFFRKKIIFANECREKTQKNNNNRIIMDINELERKINEQEGYLSLAFPALMRKVYLWMTLALGITALTAYIIASSPSLLSLVYSSKWTFLGLIGGELALVFWVSARIERLSLTKATLLFILYSALNGVTMAAIFVMYSPDVITKTFLVTAGTFGLMAVYGYYTKADLSSMGKIMIMCVLGLIISIVVNLFLQSSMVDLVISCIGVVVFTGLTAYDSQKIKQMLAMQTDMDEGAQKVALMGALSLYLDFINLFLYLLRLFGRER